jgi:hypothetical protein
MAMSGREQARLLGLFFWLLTGLQVVVIGLIGLFYVFIFGAVIASAPRKADGPPPEMFFGIIVVVMVVLAVMTALFSIPKVVAGYGLRKEKSWAKIWAIIACIMACMSFPLGTAVGVYGLVFIFGDAGKAYFEGPEFGRFPSSNVPPPPPNSWQS